MQTLLAVTDRDAGAILGQLVLVSGAFLLATRFLVHHLRGK